MIKVDLLTGDIRQIQGISRYIKQIIASRELFRANNVELGCLYSCDAMYMCNQFDTATNANNADKVTYSASKVKDGIKKALNKSATFHAACVFRDYQGISKKSANRLLEADSKADIILCEDLFATYEYLRRTHDSDRKKIVFTSHAEDDLLGQMLMQREPLRGTVYEKLLRAMVGTVIGEADLVVAICQSSYKYLTKEFNSNCVLINNAVADPSTSDVSITGDTHDDAINCAIVGSVTVRKGQDLLIEALNEYKKTHNGRLRLHFFGDGAERKKLESLVNDYGLAEDVVFYGNVDDIERRLSRMDVFLAPTRMDTVPLSIIEAMRSGLPIFATNVGGVPELVSEGVNGYLYQPTVASIKQMLIDIEARSDSLKALGSASYALYRDKYSMDNFVNSYCRAFESVI